MAGVKSVQMFYDVFHENLVHNKEDRGRFDKAIILEYFNKEQYDHQLIYCRNAQTAMV